MSPSASALVGIDWGTTNRRAWLLAPDGTCAAEASDDQGVLAAKGRFEASLGELLQRLPGLAADTPVVMSG
ncbi:MAG: 2-dehydro-3-deoxygalactonokinase, partial [Rhizobacter sp.]